MLLCCGVLRECVLFLLMSERDGVLCVVLSVCVVLCCLFLVVSGLCLFLLFGMVFDSLLLFIVVLMCGC